jgi:hypothetical protein
VGKGEFVWRRVPALDVLDRAEQVEVVAQRPRDGAQPADMLGVPPAGVVPAAVGVGDERDARRQRTGRR